MRSEKTTPARFSRFDVREDYAHTLAEQTNKERGDNATLYEEGYIIALRTSPDGQWYIGKDGEDETTLADSAKCFDAYADAVRYMVEHCEIPNMPAPVPRGFERPKYPRVCFYRLYEEITEL